MSTVAPEPPSPMITSVTPTFDPDTSLSLEAELQNEEDGGSSPGLGPSKSSLSGGGSYLGRDPSQRPFFYNLTLPRRDCCT
ncbi:Transient-receptor-potential-like protein [Dissostichus eleginoides]|uniref:Transient-receptor-potential-like protein n=1 Tax=Dissostichus eleginoides TaxID=100907 RepID=A0AAD9C4L0_DISEL|nr:Transient-receptor-potential-like protein [Dissostichus eleginoides]